MTTRFFRLPSPLITVNRVLATLVLAVLGFFVLLALPFAGLTLYLLLLMATVFAVRSVPVRPGAWLGRRAIRRGLVTLIGALTLAIAALPAFSGGFGLLLLLGVCDAALGKATQRIGSAETYQLDERQEAVRNRAHRIAYPMLAIAVGGVLLVGETAGAASRQWLSTVFQSGALISFLELLFFLPAMVIGWLEPDRIAGTDAPRLETSQRARLAGAMVTLCVALPIILSLSLFVAPIQTSAYTQAQPSYGLTPGAPVTEHCRYFGATKEVGIGFIVRLPISAVACWNGTRAYESWGLNDSDCLPNLSSFVTVDRISCQRTTDATGTLRFTYRAALRSPLVPFLERDVDMTLALTKDGKVVQFP